MRLLREFKKAYEREKLVILFAMVAAFVLIGWNFTLSKVEYYEESAEQSKSDTNAKKISAFSLNAYEKCRGEEDKAKQNRCYDAVKTVLDSRVLVSDLLAQNTVAQATKGLLWISAIQAIVAMIAVGLLMWTVIQTGRILGEAKETTKQAGLATSAATKSEQAHLIPEFKIVYSNEKAGFEHLHKRFFKVSCSIKNFGRTPAYNVTVAFYKEHYGRGTWHRVKRDSSELSTVRKQFCLPPSEMEYVQIFPKDEGRYLESTTTGEEGSGARFHAKWTYRTMFSSKLIEESITVVAKTAFDGYRWNKRDIFIHREDLASLADKRANNIVGRSKGVEINVIEFESTNLEGSDNQVS